MNLDAVVALAKKKPEYAAGAVGASLGLVALVRKRSRKATTAAPGVGVLTPAPVSSIDTSSNDLAGWFADQQNQLLERIRATDGGVTPSTSTASGPDAATPASSGVSGSSGDGIVSRVVDAIVGTSTPYTGGVNITSAPTTRVSVSAPLSPTGGTALMSTGGPVNNSTATAEGVAANAAAAAAYGPTGYFGTGLAGYSQTVIDSGGLAPASIDTGTTNAFLKKILNALTPAQLSSAEAVSTWNTINAEGGYTGTISTSTPAPAPAPSRGMNDMLAAITQSSIDNTFYASNTPDTFNPADLAPSVGIGALSGFSL